MVCMGQLGLGGEGVEVLRGGAGRGGAGRITLFRSLRRGLARPVKSHGFCLAVVKLCALMVRRFRLQASRKASLYSGAVKIRNSQ